MDIFLFLIYKLVPLYFIIVLGFISGRVLSISKEHLAKLLIYIITPLIVFHGTFSTKISINVVLIPISFFVIASAICMLFFWIGKLVFNGSEKNLLAFAAAAGNTGYFGLPVALALFGQETLSIVVLCILGVILFENSLGFFITARGRHTPKEAFVKLVKLPSIYAFILGIAANMLHMNFGANYLVFVEMFKGAYSVLGMMLIGLGLASAGTFEFDWKFNILSVFAKFIIWPLAGMLIIYIFKFGGDAAKVILLLSSVPVAANTVAYATELKVHPQKAAMAVFLTTIIAAIFIPIMSIYVISKI